MTSHAHSISTTPERLTSPKRSRKRDSAGDQHKADGEKDSVSVAKMGMIGTIGAAVVTAITTIVVTVSHDDGSPSANPAGQTIKPTLDSTSPQGSFDQVSINESGTEVTVTGSAQKDVDNVVVLIGPRQSGGQFWANSAAVVNGQWKLSVATEPHVPVPYEIKAYYGQRPGSPAMQGFSYLISQGTSTTETPTPTPGSIVSCAEQHGDSCFNGPGWGPPSVYQSDH